MELSNNKLNNINNNDIYIKLIKNFENHLISNEKKEAIYNYMKNYTEKNFSNDIIFILEDFNNIISQSIQAIKSLLAENERLNENNINFLQNNLNYSKQKFSNENNNYANNNNNNFGKSNSGSNSNYSAGQISPEMILEGTYPITCDDFPTLASINREMKRREDMNKANFGQGGNNQYNPYDNIFL